MDVRKQACRCAALLVVTLSASAAITAQDVRFSPNEMSEMVRRSRNCADDQIAADERIGFCSAVIKDGGLRGRELANMYIYRSRAERSTHADADAARDLDLAIKASDRYAVAWFERGNLRADLGQNREALQ